MQARIKRIVRGAAYRLEVCVCHSIIRSAGHVSRFLFRFGRAFGVAGKRIRHNNKTATTQTLRLPRRKKKGEYK